MRGKRRKATEQQKILTKKEISDALHYRIQSVQIQQGDILSLIWYPRNGEPQVIERIDAWQDGTIMIHFNTEHGRCPHVWRTIT